MIPSNQDLSDFVLREVRLLDDLRFDDWLALFAEDGRYWMPLERGQNERRLHCSLMDEDTLLLLDFYLLEKCIYEIGYELNNRPEWAEIPLRGLSFLLSRWESREG